MNICSLYSWAEVDRHLVHERLWCPSADDGLVSYDGSARPADPVAGWRDPAALSAPGPGLVRDRHAPTVARAQVRRGPYVDRGELPRISGSVAVSALGTEAAPPPASACTRKVARPESSGSHIQV